MSLRLRTLKERGIPKPDSRAIIFKTYRFSRSLVLPKYMYLGFWFQTLFAGETSPTKGMGFQFVGTVRPVDPEIYHVYVPYDGDHEFGRRRLRTVPMKFDVGVDKLTVSDLCALSGIMQLSRAPRSNIYAAGYLVKEWEMIDNSSLWSGHIHTLTLHKGYYTGKMVPWHERYPTREEEAEVESGSDGESTN
jgi:hypothetical protein